MLKKRSLKEGKRKGKGSSKKTERPDEYETRVMFPKLRRAGEYLRK